MDSRRFYTPCGRHTHFLQPSTPSDKYADNFRNPITISFIQQHFGCLRFCNCCVEYRFHHLGNPIIHPVRHRQLRKHNNNIANQVHKLGC